VRAEDTAGNRGPYSSTATAITQGAAEPISYRQSNYAVPQTPQSVVTVAFTTAQSAGSLNVVAIGWNDATSQVVSVTDSRGNTYTPASAATVQPGIQSQVIYYAANIAAGTNTVTVTFNAAASYPDVRIAEYRGIDGVTPVDAARGAFGTGTSANSGTVTTTVANALLVGASYTQSVTTGPGSGFTSRMITSPNGSILEDRIVTTVGSYAAEGAAQGPGKVGRELPVHQAANIVLPEYRFRNIHAVRASVDVTAGPPACLSGSAFRHSSRPRRAHPAARRQRRGRRRETGR